MSKEEIMEVMIKMVQDYYRHTLEYTAFLLDFMEEYPEYRNEALLNDIRAYLSEFTPNSDKK